MTTCDSCGIRLGPNCIGINDEPYCCTGCAAGGPCVCTYENDLGRYPPTHYARPVSLAELLGRYEEGIRTTGRPADGRPEAAEDLS